MRIGVRPRRPSVGVWGKGYRPSKTFSCGCHLRNTIAFEIPRSFVPVRSALRMEHLMQKKVQE